MVCAFFFVVVSGRFIPMTAVITSAVPVQIRGGFMSLNTAVQAAGSGMSSLLSGYIVTQSTTGELQNHHYVGYLAVGLGLIASVLIWKIKPVSAQPVKDFSPEMV
ncbi:MAG: hypothetical protein SGI98_07905 [Verrucomicrobiota bacterium]|nr:hypothetical protein [Verrucomicrobiota bacterium]